MLQRRRQLNVLFVLIALTCSGAGGCSTEGKKVPGIHNFATVEEGAFYRGGQPAEAGIAALQQKGVRTVIDLRDDPNPSERRWVEAAGMRYVNIPSTAMRVEPQKVAAFLSEMTAAPRPIFVHCFHGRDRTGLDVAVYRIVRENWSREAALRELYAHGYHWALFPGIAQYVKTFDPAAYGPSAVPAAP